MWIWYDMIWPWKGTPKQSDCGRFCFAIASNLCRDRDGERTNDLTTDFGIDWGVGDCRDCLGQNMSNHNSFTKMVREALQHISDISFLFFSGCCFGSVSLELSKGWVSSRRLRHWDIWSMISISESLIKHQLESQRRSKTPLWLEAIVLRRTKLRRFNSRECLCWISLWIDVQKRTYTGTIPVIYHGVPLQWCPGWNDLYYATEESQGEMSTFPARF